MEQFKEVQDELKKVVAQNFLREQKTPCHNKRFFSWEKWWTNLILSGKLVWCYFPFSSWSSCSPHLSDPLFAVSYVLSTDAMFILGNSHEENIGMELIDLSDFLLGNWGEEKSCERNEEGSDHQNIIFPSLHSFLLLFLQIYSKFF